ASSLSSGEYLPGSLQGKISSDGCLKKEQMVVSAIASTPHHAKTHCQCNFGHFHYSFPLLTSLRNKH
ncbi:hypothetical protein ACVODM_11420, partial [Shigella flexneri]